MQLHEKYSDQVAGIALNVDFNEAEGAPDQDLENRVRDMLAKLEIHCENILLTDRMDQVLEQYNLFGLPAVLVFDQQGRLHQKFDGGVDYAKQVVPAVEGLLEDAPGDAEDAPDQPAEPPAAQAGDNS